MPVTPGLQLPYGIQPVNPLPVDSLSGPFTGSSDTVVSAVAAANAGISSALRFKSMEVRLIVGGVSRKFWYRDGITDDSLVEFVGGSGGYTAGSDVYFHVSGSIGGAAKSLFGGDLVSSGTITAKAGFSGSHTQLADGTSFLVAGTNVTITSASSGQVTISASGGGGGSPGGSDTFVQFNDAGSFGGTGGLTFNKTTGAFQVTGSLIASSSTGLFVFDGTQPTVTVRASADTTNQAVFYQESVGDTYFSNQKNGGGLYSSVKTTAGVAVRFMRAIPNSINYNTIVAFLQGLHDFFDPKLETTDVGFYVGGKKGSKDSTTRGVALFAGDMVVSGSTHMQNGGSITGSFSIQGSIIPSADSAHTLGTDTKRWAHVYTGDLHLRNERGDWTILEEPDFLCVINNKTGRKYKMILQPID